MHPWYLAPVIAERPALLRAAAALLRAHLTTPNAAVPAFPHPRACLAWAAFATPAGRALVRYHAEHVLDYALVAARKVGLADQPFTLVLNGGIFRDAGGTLLTALREACEARRIPHVTLVRGRYEPAVGALLHAFDRAGYPLDAERIGHIEASVPPADFFATHT